MATPEISTKRQLLLIDEPDFNHTKRQRIIDELDFIIHDEEPVSKNKKSDDELLQFVLCNEDLTSALDITGDDPIFYNEDTNNINVGTCSTMMVAGSFYIPKFNEEKPLGEDAHFICAAEQTIGVADGVGGWSRKGIDSGRYSRQLMKNAESSIHKQKQEDNGCIDLMKVLNEAFLHSNAKGSSTACMLTLANDTLHAVNVGDSGFVVIRDGLIVYKSEIQQSRFNCPFQLGNGEHSDNPSVAERISVPVQAGDVVVLGTDGLFDNVHDYELELLVKNGVDSWETDVPEMLAWRIAQYALDNSKETKLYTPFARESLKAGFNHSGGKYDDITVIVAHIWPL